MRNMTYFDLIIVEHSSFIEKDMLKVWKVLEKLHLSRSVRNIGLSGFSIPHMKYILSVAVIKPFAVQALFNPYSVNLELIKFCQMKICCFLPCPLLITRNLVKNFNQKTLFLESLITILLVQLRFCWHGRYRVRLYPLFRR